jgi:hypothetical protein
VTNVGATWIETQKPQKCAGHVGWTGNPIGPWPKMQVGMNDTPTRRPTWLLRRWTENSPYTDAPKAMDRAEGPMLVTVLGGQHHGACVKAFSSFPVDQAGSLGSAFRAVT